MKLLLALGFLFFLIDSILQALGPGNLGAEYAFIAGCCLVGACAYD
jgi:hypothetical protein